MIRFNLKSLVCLIALTLFGKAKTQTLTCANTCPQAESIFSIKTASPVIGSNGQNKLWNFSSVQAVSNTQETYAYLTPSAVAQSTLYPQASMVLQKNAVKNYYLRLANDGIKTAYPSTVTTNVQEVVLPLPFSYGNTFTQTIISTAVDNGDTYVTTKNCTISCTGTGTVVLPWSTYNNVVKVETTSNWTMTKNGAAFGYKQYLTEHTYYSTDIKHRVIYYSQRYEDGPTDYAPYTELLSAEITGVATHMNSDNGFSIYPNPASEEIKILLPSENKAIIKLCSLNCDELITQTFSASTGSVDTSALPKGLYLLVVEQEGKSFVQKISIQ